MSAKLGDSHQNLGIWPPQPSSGHSYMQHVLYVERNLQNRPTKCKRLSRKPPKCAKGNKEKQEVVYFLHSGSISELSHQALFLPPRKTRAKVCAPASPILEKWPKLRDNLSCPLCFKGKGWWPLRNAQLFHAQRTPPGDQVFLGNKAVATHLIYGNVWSFPHSLERGGQPPPPFKDRGALGLSPK